MRHSHLMAAESNPSDRIAEMFLRERSSHSALRRQAASLVRRSGQDDALASHLSRSERRLAVLHELLREHGGAPPPGVEAVFRSMGWIVGTLTSIGGGRRTIRAIEDSAAGLARMYSLLLSEPIPPETAYRLAQNYRDVLLLMRWAEERCS